MSDLSLNVWVIEVSPKGRHRWNVYEIRKNRQAARVTLKSVKAMGTAARFFDYRIRVYGPRTIGAYE